MRAIREWRRGKTTVIITHDLSQIEDHEYAYVLDKGLIVQEGYRYALEKNPIGPLAAPRKPSISFPHAKRLPRLPEESRKRSVTTMSSLSRGSIVSVRSIDSLNIQYHPRPQSIFIPAIFSPPAEDLRYDRRAPFEPFISPAAAGAYTMHRMSGIPGVFGHLPDGVSQPLASPDPMPDWPLSSAREQKMRDLSLVNELHKSAYNAGRTAVERRTAHTMKSQSELIPLKAMRRPTEYYPVDARRPIEAVKESSVAPIQKILLTIWPTLTWKHRPLLLGGFLFAGVHAAATPLFSWVFSKLLATFFLPANRSREALKWSLSVLGVGGGDALAVYFMHYLLEACGQAWVDSLRIEAMKRIIDQPRAWFDRDKNSVPKLTECLDRNAEEMRNSLGRFAGFMFVVVVMLLVALIWSLVVCWSLRWSDLLLLHSSILSPGLTKRSAQNGRAEATTLALLPHPSSLRLLVMSKQCAPLPWKHIYTRSILDQPRLLSKLDYADLHTQASFMGFLIPASFLLRR